MCDCIMIDAVTPKFHTQTTMKGDGIKIEVYVRTNDKGTDHICISCLKQVLHTMEYKVVPGE